MVASCSSTCGAESFAESDTIPRIPAEFCPVSVICRAPPIVETRRGTRSLGGGSLIGNDLHHGLLTLVRAKCRAGNHQETGSPHSGCCHSGQHVEYSKNTRLRFSTITFDNRTEFHDYKAVGSGASSVKCYFATPYHSWERGKQRKPQWSDPPVSPKRNVHEHRDPG